MDSKRFLLYCEIELHTVQLDVHIMGDSSYTHLSGTAPFSVAYWIHPRCEECKIHEATLSTSKGKCSKAAERSSTALPHLLTFRIKKTNHCREKGFCHMESDQAGRDNELWWGSPESKFSADLTRAFLITWNYIQILNCLCSEVKKVWSQLDFSFFKIACGRF